MIYAIFFKLAEAFIAYRKFGGKLMAVDHTYIKDGEYRLVKRYRLYTPGTMAHTAVKISSKDEHLYELLVDDLCTRVYLDIDGYGEGVDERVKKIIELFRKRYGSNIPVCVLKCHRKTKRSFHLTFPTLIFPSKEGVRDAVLRLCLENTEIFKDVDLGVYDKNRTMRTLNQSKKNKIVAENSPPLVYDDAIDGPVPDSFPGQWMIQHPSLFANQTRDPIKDAKEVISKIRGQQRKRKVVENPIEEDEKSAASPAKRVRKRRDRKGDYHINEDKDFLLPDAEKEKLKDHYNVFLNYAKSLTAFIDQETVVNWMVDAGEDKDGVSREERRDKHRSRLRDQDWPLNSWIKGDYAMSVIESILRLNVIDHRNKPDDIFMPEVNYSDDLPLMPMKTEEFPDWPVWENIKHINGDELSTSLRTSSKLDVPGAKNGVVVTGQMGAGKTKGIVDFIVDSVLLQRKNCTYISPRVLLVEQFTTALLKTLADKLRKGSSYRRGHGTPTFAIRIKFGGAEQFKSEIMLENENYRELVQTFKGKSIFADKERVDPSVPIIHIVVINSLYVHVRDTPNFKSELVVMDELAVIVGNYGMGTKDEKTPTKLGSFYIQRALSKVIDICEFLIFVDAGMSKNQLALCQRLLGLTEHFLKEETQLQLYKENQKRESLSSKKTGEMTERILKKNIKRRKTTLVKTVDDNKSVLNEKNFTRDEIKLGKNLLYKITDVVMKPSLFVCNNPLYNTIFEKIVFIENKDTFVARIIDSLNSGKFVAGAYSKAETMSQDLLKITANSKSKFVVPFCKPIFSDKIKNPGCVKTSLEAAPRSHIFTFTQKLGVGFSIENKDAFDEVYVHLECDQYSPNAADMVQLTARIRSIKSKTLFVHLRKNKPLRLNFKPNLEFAQKPLVEESVLHAVLNQHFWTEEIKKVLGKMSAACEMDYLRRFMRGFMGVTKVDGVVSYTMPEHEIDSARLTEGSLSVLNSNTERLKSTRQKYPADLYERHFHNTEVVRGETTYKRTILPRLIQEEPTDQLASDVMASQLEGGVESVTVPVADRTGEIACYSLQELAPEPFVAEYLA
ncbi:ORF89 [Haliotid herpesvirus 1]|nr:ORF89 [Haliotid herpesvirus 1]